MKTRNKFSTCDEVEHAIRTNLYKLSTYHSDILCGVENVQLIEYETIIQPRLNSKRTSMKLIVNGHNLDLHIYLEIHGTQPFFAWHLI